MRITGLFVKRWVGAMDELKGALGLSDAHPSWPLPLWPGTCSHPRGAGHWAPVLAVGTGEPVGSWQGDVCLQSAAPAELWGESHTLLPTTRVNPMESMDQIHRQLLQVFLNLIFKLQCGINIGFYFWFPEMNFERINILLWHWKFSCSEKGTCCWIKHILVFFFFFWHFIGFKC